MSIPKDQIGEVLKLLCDRFPNCFAMFQARRRPLKIGIHHDILAVLGDEIDRKILGNALRVYVSNVGYLRAQREGADRIDLDGKPADVVTADEAANARRALDGIKAKQLKRRKPEATPAPEPTPRRDGLAALREAAKRRKTAV
jgi:ProP effector